MWQVWIRNPSYDLIWELWAHETELRSRNYQLPFTI